MTDMNKSPDMIIYDEVIRVLSNNPRAFASERDLARVLSQINSLQKYDLHSVPDNIDNNYTTINIVTDKDSVRELISKIKANVGVVNGNKK